MYALFDCVFQLPGSKNKPAHRTIDRLIQEDCAIPELYWYYAGYLFVLNICEFSAKLYLSSFKDSNRSCTHLMRLGNPIY